MSNRSAELLIEDILASAKKIQRYTTGMTFEQFADDEKTADAVARNFEIIGEAANRLPDEFKAQLFNYRLASDKRFSKPHCSRLFRN